LIHPRQRLPAREVFKRGRCRFALRSLGPR
jgi:hypothetical protein